jgi:urease accessory protein
MMDWLPHLLQTSDSLFPTGAYAHSGALEEMVSLGVVRDAPSLAAFLRDHAHPLLARHELPYVGFARRAAQAGDASLLAELDREYAASRLCREAREASAQVGAQRLRLLLRLAGEQTNSTPADFHRQIAKGNAQGHLVIVWGLQAAASGTPVEAAWSAFAYQALAGYASAALKLLRIGPESCQAVLSEALREIPATIRYAETVEREDAGSSDPLWDIAAARHERAFARLFIS